MGLVYVYLATWIAGGVLLGSNMLLEQPASLQSSLAGPEGELAPQEPPPRRASRSSLRYLLALALTGFGLGGMLAEGLGLVSSPWTAVCALLGCALLGVVGYLSLLPKRA
jgi:hypothetical protein